MKHLLSIIEPLLSIDTLPLGIIVFLAFIIIIQFVVISNVSKQNKRVITSNECIEQELRLVNIQKTTLERKYELYVESHKKLEKELSELKAKYVRGRNEKGQFISTKK